MPWLAQISAGTLTNDLAVRVEHLKVDRRTAVDAGRCIAELQRKHFEYRGQLRQDRRQDAGHDRGGRLTPPHTDNGGFGAPRGQAGCAGQ
jgi:hypothetical protein